MIWARNNGSNDERESASCNVLQNVAVCCSVLQCVGEIMEAMICSSI